MINTYIRMFQNDFDSGVLPKCNLKKKDLNLPTIQGWFSIVLDELHYDPYVLTMNTDSDVYRMRIKQIDAAVFQFASVVGFHLINNICKLYHTRNTTYWNFTSTIKFEIPIPQNYHSHIPLLEDIKYSIMYFLLRRLDIVYFKDDVIIRKTGKSKNSIKYKLNFKKITEYNTDILRRIFINYSNLLNDIIDHSNFNFVDGFVTQRTLYFITSTDNFNRVSEYDNYSRIHEVVLEYARVNCIFESIGRYMPDLNIINSHNCQLYVYDRPSNINMFNHIHVNSDFSNFTTLPGTQLFTTGSEIELDSEPPVDLPSTGISKVSSRKQKKNKVIKSQNIIKSTVKQDLF